MKRFIEENIFLFIIFHQIYIKKTTFDYCPTFDVPPLVNCVSDFFIDRGASFGAALVLTHLEQYHRPQANTNL